MDMKAAKLDKNSKMFLLFLVIGLGLTMIFSGLVTIFGEFDYGKQVDWLSKLTAAVVYSIPAWLFTVVLTKVFESFVKDSEFLYKSTSLRKPAMVIGYILAAMIALFISRLLLGIAFSSFWFYLMFIAFLVFLSAIFTKKLKAWSLI